MLASLLMSLFVNNLRVSFPRAASYISLLLSTFFSLLIYYFTSKAFAKSFFDSESGYFEYILVGELSLLVISSSLYNSTHLIRSWKTKGIFDYLLSSKVSTVKTISLQLISTLARDLSMVILQLTLAYAIFGLSLSLSKMAVLIFYPLLALPLFICLGFISLSLILYFGRGGAVGTTLTNVFSFLSGVFFPISFLPSYLQGLSFHNPFSVVLLPIRSFLAHSEFEQLLVASWPILIWTMASAVIAVLCFKVSLAEYRKDNNRFSFDY
ncbi:MAG: hypothetical protein CME71_10240 [Halobacteriovorax sp.]|nr:hypothetical protein [Halobacteriovorax sp.]